jgi:guanosine-3',5'-bis(diphosphate) 3'-pyrophosphohydrolase
MQQSQKARVFATVAHEGQTYGPGESYMVHLDAVAALVGDDDTTKAIAYLHDVVEDTPVLLAVVKEIFGPFVAECVAILTDEPGINRKERKAASHAKLAKVEHSHFVALVVKAADRTANVAACARKGNAGLLQMYWREQEAFKAAAYRPGLCDHLWDRIEAALASDHQGG